VSATDTDRDGIITFYASDGHEIAEIALRIEEMHPRLADDTEGHPLMKDEAGNILHLDECPVCGGLFSWCVAGPDEGRIQYSARLMQPCLFAPPEPRNRT